MLLLQDKRSRWTRLILIDSLDSCIASLLSPMPRLAVLLIGASITPSLALEASGVCGGAVGCCGLVRDDCLYQDNKDVTDRILANNAVGRRLWKTYDGGVHNW